MNEAMEVTTLDHAVGACAQKKAEGYRFVTMTCTALGEDLFDLMYHFDKDLRLSHLRLQVSRATRVPSISAVYFAAFLVENEIQDLFGLRFSGLTLDYLGTLYLDEEAGKAPLSACAEKKPAGPPGGIAMPSLRACAEKEGKKQDVNDLEVPDRERFRS